MMDLDAQQQALFASNAAGLIHLIELDFAQGTQYVTSFNLALQIGAVLYRPAGSLVQVGAIKHTLETDTQSTEISLSVAEKSLLAMALGNVEQYRGRQARILLQPMDEKFRLVGAPREYFSGEMEPVQIDRTSPGPDGGDVTGAIKLPVTRAGLSRARNQDPLRLTDAQQKADYPGDRGLEGQRELIDKPALWISKRFQESQ